jgi:hypothetical protein
LDTGDYRAQLMAIDRRVIVLVGDRRGDTIRLPPRP